MSTRNSRITAIVAIIMAIFAPLAIGAAGNVSGQSNVEFLEGTDVQRRLTVELSGSWSSVPLADVTAGLSRTQHVAIMLDRRVDPTQSVSLHVSRQPLSDVLAELAQDKKLDMLYLGSVVYLAPRGEASRLLRAAKARREDIRRLPPPLARRFRSEAAMAWNDLATPRSLLMGLCHQGGITVANPQQLPHDLWAAAAVPKLALVDRLSLILGQFSLTYEIIPAAKLPSENSHHAARGLQNVSPHSDLSIDIQTDAPRKGPAIRIVPIVDEPLDDNGNLSPKRSKKTASPPKRRYRQSSGKAGGEIRIERFNVSQSPLEPLLEQLAARLGLTLQLDRQAITAAGIDLNDQVSLSVTDVTVDELFAKLLEPLGLSARRNGTALNIGPRRQHNKRQNLPKR